MILAIDTATRWLGLALHDGTAVVAEEGWRCANNHTIELTPAVAKMLARAELTAADLDGIAVAIGPGSYTGLRVGLALAKGLALANQTPLLGISTLHVVAAGVGQQPGQLVAVVAAGRKRVSTAVYQWHKTRGWQSDTIPDTESWEELLPRLAGATLFAGEITPEAAQAIRKASSDFRVASGALATRRAGVLAELGWQRLRRGDSDDAATLAPIYLRDAAGGKIERPLRQPRLL